MAPDLSKLRERFPDSGLPQKAWDQAQAFMAVASRGSFVAGEFLPAATYLQSRDPGTGQRIARIPEADREVVDRAVAASRTAVRAWSRTSPRDRERAMHQLADAIDAHADTFALLEVLDGGRLLAEVRDWDLPDASWTLHYFAGWASKVHGSTVPVSSPGVLNYTVREPVGVVAAIIPWNYALLFAVERIATALAFGNAICLKPAEQVSLSALYLATLVAELDFPPGLINVLPGRGGVTGRALVAHPRVDKIAFTGSEATGRRIARTAGEALKSVTLELGGKSPNIVFADAGLDDAIDASLSAIFTNAGQICTAGSRLFVADALHDRFLEALAQRSPELKVGHGLDPGTEVGPLVSAPQRRRVLRYIEKGLEDGALLVTGGSCPEDKRGYFVEPTVFSVEDGDSRISSDEIFGPVLVVQRFTNTDDVIAAANRTAFGLAAGVWTRDIARAHRVAAELEAGTVWINTFNLFDPASPAGGRKASGVGREYGEAALEAYTERKSVWVNLEEPA